jgi:copper(I)-binding protein
MTTGAPQPPGQVQSGPPRRVLTKGLITEWVLIAIIAGELAFFLWIFFNPDMYTKPPVVPADAPQVIASNPDLPPGGGLSFMAATTEPDAPADIPAVAPSPEPAAATGKDDKGHQAAAKGEDLHLYLTIDNAGAAASLTGATSAQAAGTSLWQIPLAGTAAKPVAQGITIPANSVTTLDEEHGWIALSGLTSDFKKGDTIEVTLTFDGMEPVTLEVPIYRTSEAASGSPAKQVTAGDLSLGAYWAEPASPDA